MLGTTIEVEQELEPSPVHQVVLKLNFCDKTSQGYTCASLITIVLYNVFSVQMGKGSQLSHESFFQFYIDVTY